MKVFLNQRERLFFGLAMGILLMGQLAVLFYYGDRKAGFHEDELYTYYSTNKTAGLFVDDRQWVEREEIRNDFVVLPGERFRFSVVKQMQSWDVHPPLYYYIFHTVCSLFPGVFGKWLGIGVNMIAYVVSFVLLSWGVYTAAERDSGEASQRRGMILSFLTCFGWGFSAAVISGVMFIRMYQWLTLFVLLCMDLHLRAVKKQDFRIRSFLLPVGITVFLGFLTQYYYIIFHFFLGTGFCLWLLRNRKIREIFAYGVFCGLGFLGAVCYYPASLAHIFRGYRGTEAVSEFGDVSNTWDRLRFFAGLFDDFVMNHTLSAWLLVICLLGVTAGYLRKRKSAKSERFGVLFWLPAFACGGYFFVISKTALLLGETSNRYQLPVYGILLFLLLYAVWMLWEGIAGSWKIKWMPVGAVLLLVLAVTNSLALKNGKVFFLYEEEREVMEFVREHAETPVVVFYNEASPDNVWRLSDELMEYPRVYLASQGNEEPVRDESIEGSESLLVYVADHKDQEKCIERLLEENERLSSDTVVARKGLWTLHELN